MTQTYDIEPDPLTVEELNYLLTLAAKQRRKRESERKRISAKPGQSPAAFAEALERFDASSEWVAGVEDHLIRLVAEEDESLLSEHHQARLCKLLAEEAA